MQKLGLVTVLYKSDDVLEGFLSSISIQDHVDFVLYMVDNSESETTDALLATLLIKFPVTKYVHIKTGGNIGVAAGNNTGIKEAFKDSCTHILLLNNDIVLEQGFAIRKLLEVSVQKNNAVVVPKILYYDNRKVWMAGGYMDNLRALGVHYVAHDENDEKVTRSKRITYAPTCFMLIHSSVFEKIGFMDEKYFAYYDDTDFIYRAVKLGIEAYYEPGVTVLHKVSTSSGGDKSLFYIYYSNRNKVYFIKKHYKGLRKLFAMAYLFISRTAFYFKFDPKQKEKLKTAIRDGFKM
jgi:GT2 family glycosyltransferase